MNTKKLLQSYFKDYQTWEDFRQIGSASAGIAMALQNNGVYAFLTQDDVDLLLKQQERIDRYRFRVMDVERILEANYWVPGMDPDTMWVTDKRAKKILEFFCEEAEDHALRTGTENKLAAVIQQYIASGKFLTKYHQTEVGSYLTNRWGQGRYEAFALADGLDNPDKPDSHEAYMDRDVYTWITQFLCTYYDNIGLRGTAAGDRKWDAFLALDELERSMTKLAQRLQQRIDVNTCLKEMRQLEADEQARKAAEEAPI